MSEAERQARLRQLPKVDRVAHDAALDVVRAKLGERTITGLARSAVAHARKRVLHGDFEPSLAAAVTEVEAAARAMLQARSTRVINATGVIIHTNLGRAPLSASACDILRESAAGYTSIELDLHAGKRGARGAFIDRALCQLTGAEDALVVNNCAAAVLLVLTALAKDRPVLVSRGELIEIGGGFRVPEVLARSRAEMLEVGTTNKTHLRDFERALDENPGVAAVLRVHPSNFRQTGFVARPSLPELVELCRARDVLLIEDLGGGAMVELEGVHEPLVRDVVSQGADIVCFSCDKALGGPQGGAIVGRRELVTRTRRDPLARALRLGRLPLIALEATLAHYLEGSIDQVPAVRALRASLDEVRTRVEGWQRALSDRGVASEVTATGSLVGGGTAAEEPVASVSLALQGDVDSWAARLRRGEPPVLARIHQGRLLLDGRSVLPGEDGALLDAVTAALR